MTASIETISVVGLGYIGLPTATVFASRNLKVIGVDVTDSIVDTINRGEIHIVEPGLEAAVENAVKKGNLRATLVPEPADAFLIAVPTPFKEGQYGNAFDPDLSYIEAAARGIAPVLKPGNLVVLESTSPVGATEQMAQWLAEERPDLTFPQTHGEDADIQIAHCPERVLPGHVLRELVQNDRIIGGMTRKCSETAVKLYKLIVEGECIITNVKTAEMCKLTENSFRDVNIAFANELSIICQKLGINVSELISLANHHPRVNILQPGPGVGGHCIAVDPWFIVASAPRDARLIRNARETNNLKTDWVIQQVLKRVEKLQIQGKDSSEITISCYGAAFKPDIDDLRESPAVKIIREIRANHKGTVFAIEPNVDKLPEVLANVELRELGQNNGADIRVYLVRHKEFLELEPDLERDMDFCGLFPHLLTY